MRFPLSFLPSLPRRASGGPGPRRFRTWLPDLSASLTAVALLAPESVAYAQTAGIPPAYALASAPAALLAYALFGRSASLVVGATAATAVLTAATTASITTDPAQRVVLAGALAVASGLILYVTGAAGFGFIARFLAPEVLVGFLFGLALVVIVRQVGTVVGIPAGAGNFFEKAWRLLVHASHWRVASVVTGLATLCVLLVLERRLPRIPATLVALVLAWLASGLFDLHHHGVQTVGRIAASLPSLRVPEISLQSWANLIGAALGIALIVFVMTYSVESQIGSAGQSPPDANREMRALGVANVAVGLLGGFAVSGSPSASPAARDAGARSRTMSSVAALLFLLVAAFATPAFSDLPEPALAAVVIAAVRRFLAVRTLRTLLDRDAASLWIATSALLGVLVFELLPGLLIAVAVSLLLFVTEASRLKVSELVEDADTGAIVAHDEAPRVERWPGLLVVRPEGELFFANVGALETWVGHRVTEPRLNDEGDLHVVILDLGSTFDFRVPVLDALDRIRASLRSRGVELWLALASDADLGRASANSVAPRRFHDLGAAITSYTQPGEGRRREAVG